MASNSLHSSLHELYSIGSLGIGGGNHTVEEVHVRNCSFRGTTNGARIKTWKVISIGYNHNMISRPKKKKAQFSNFFFLNPYISDPIPDICKISV